MRDFLVITVKVNSVYIYQNYHKICPSIGTRFVGTLPVDAELVVIDSSMSRIGPEDDAGVWRPVTRVNIQST